MGFLLLKVILSIILGEFPTIYSNIIQNTWEFPTIYSNITINTLEFPTIYSNITINTLEVPTIYSTITHNTLEFPAIYSYNYSPDHVQGHRRPLKIAAWPLTWSTVRHTMTNHIAEGTRGLLGGRALLRVLQDTGHCCQHGIAERDGIQTIRI